MKLNIELPIVGSPSRAENAGNCNRRHILGDILCQHLVGGRRDYFDFGTVIHDGAAHWWELGDVEAVMTVAKQRFDGFGDSMPGPKDQHTWELTEELLRLYFDSAKLAGDHWAADSGKWEIVALERRVIVEPTPEAALSFQLDRLVRLVDSDPPIHVLLDTKTAHPYFWSGKHREKWGRSLQQQLYQGAVRRDLGIGDGDLTHYVERLKKKIPSELDYVLLPEWTQPELDEAWSLFLNIVQKDAELVERCRLPDGTVDVDALTDAALIYPDYNPNHCYDFGGCEFQDLCFEPPQIRRSTLAREYEYQAPVYLE